VIIEVPDAIAPRVAYLVRTAVREIVRNGGNPHPNTA
jgi:hypothetical protein